MPSSYLFSLSSDTREAEIDSTAFIISISDSKSHFCVKSCLLFGFKLDQPIRDHSSYPIRVKFKTFLGYPHEQGTWEAAPDTQATLWGKQSWLTNFSCIWPRPDTSKTWKKCCNTSWSIDQTSWPFSLSGGRIAVKKLSTADNFERLFKKGQFC